MKKTALLLLVLLLILPTALAETADDAATKKTQSVGSVNVSNEFVITAWEDPFEDTTANRLIISHVGNDSGMTFDYPQDSDTTGMIALANNACAYTTENLGYGDFVIAKLDDENFLRFCYDGTTADPDTRDEAYCAFRITPPRGEEDEYPECDVASAWYPGQIDGQVKRLYSVYDINHPNPIAYIQFYREEGRPIALRVEWDPDGAADDEYHAGPWKVSIWDGTVSSEDQLDYADLMARAMFGFEEHADGVPVSGLQTSLLNVRAIPRHPDSPVIERFNNGDEVRVYRIRATANDSNMTAFIPISWTVIDDDHSGIELRYFGWAAQKYLPTDGLGLDWQPGD